MKDETDDMIEPSFEMVMKTEDDSDEDDIDQDELELDLRDLDDESESDNKEDETLVKIEEMKANCLEVKLETGITLKIFRKRIDKIMSLFPLIFSP